MNWFAWRQHRKQFLIFGILLAAFAALIIPTGIHFWNTYQDALASCAQNPALPMCSNLGINLFQSEIDTLLFHLIPVALVVLPLILGIFWGAPLLAREYTEGTNSLAWTQSVSRRKWLSVKLVWILVATAAFMGAFAALTTWWAKTPNTLYMERFSSGIWFSAEGIVPVAYGLFTVAVGIMSGAWFKKTMVAIGVTFSLFIALVFIAFPNFIRPHFMTPITVTASMGPNATSAKIPNGAWVISQNIVDKNGKSVGNFNLSDWPSQCQQLIKQAQSSGDDLHIKVGPGSAVDNCLNNAGFRQVAKYQPPSRYWDFQWIETGIYLALAAIALATTYWLVLKRDA